MTGTILEDLHGVGALYEGTEPVGTVIYSIKVREDGTGADAAKKRHAPVVEAVFEPHPGLDFSEFLNEPLTLELQDGRRWECRIQTREGRVTGGDWPLRKNQRPW